MKLRGTEGFDLGEAWKDGVRAYLGYSVTGFPNMLFHYGPLSPSGFSIGPTAAELQGDWTTDFLLTLRNEGFTRLEPDPAAECAWTEMDIGRASVRERGGKHVCIQVDAVQLQKKQANTENTIKQRNTTR